MHYRIHRMAALLAAAVLLSSVLVGCSGAGQATAVAGQATGQAEATLEPVRSDNSVIAEGRVVPAQDANLSFSASGVVSEMLITEGDQVEAGQTLMRLSGDEQLQSAVAAAELELLEAQQSLEDLNMNADMERANAQLAVAEAVKELDKAQKRTNSLEYRRGSDDQIAVARANYLLAQREFEDAEGAYAWLKDAGSENLNAAEGLSALAAARQQRDKALANLNYMLSKPNEMDVAEIDAQLAVAQAKMAEAEEKLGKLTNGPDADQMALAEAKIKNARLKVEAAQASLKDTELLAPFAGTISAVEVTAGEFVQPGTTVVQLADFTSWVVETTDLTELNVARVAVGQPALVKFDALPEEDFIARVTRISPLGENRQGDVVYTVRLKLDKPDARLRWNMTASVKFLENEP